LLGILEFVGLAGFAGSEQPTEETRFLYCFFRSPLCTDGVSVRAIELSRTGSTHHGGLGLFDLG